MNGPQEQFKTRYPHLAKEPLITSRKRGNAENRIWAKFIDICLVLPLIYITQLMFPLLVLPLSICIWALLDALGKGQSPGKWLLGLHTIEVVRGEALKFYNGMIRNIVFAIFCTALVKTGLFWGLVGLVCAIGILLESYFILILRSGIRVGDILGYTRVFDYKDIHTQFIEQFLKKEEPQ